MSANSLHASFDSGKFRISWNFQTNEHELQSYDRIEVREQYEADEDITCAVQVTQSSMRSDNLTIRPLAPLNMADGIYYAVYISSTSEREIARSSFFTARTIAAASFEEDFLVDDEECILNIVQVHAVTVPGKENCEIDIEWKFKDDTGGLLSKNDYICIIPSKKVEDLTNVFHDHAYGLASGEDTGKVSIQLGGFVRVGYEYQVFYLLNHAVKGVIRKGASDPFVLKDAELPYFDNPAATRAASQQHNVSTPMQYAMHDQMKNLKAAAAYNPLLTITPRKDKQSMHIEQIQQDHQTTEDELLVHLEDIAIAAAEGGAIVETDDFVNESKLTKLITASLRSKSCFLFAGPGISELAPASVPSWSKLMSDVLEETYRTVPEELRDIAMKLHSTESIRRPEEVMETYYFVLQEKLFDLLNMLGKGKPNANHKLIAKMVKFGKVKTILTTNFDEFIEQALEDEGVHYKVVCTSEEFKEYHQNGCEEFVILKIHGTLSRPDTIISLATHYKISGGFEGYKATVAHHLIENFPTVFLGYSGWDFAHKHYQEFWDAVGRKGGENIYFMRLKGSTGGPLLSNLIGRHVGERLIIGEGTLPETAISIWERFDSYNAKRILKSYNNSISSDTESAHEKQQEFIKFWVHQIPTASLLAIVWNESIYSNESTTLRHEKMRERRMLTDGPTIMSAATTDGVTSYLMDLSAKFAQGIITNEVYMEKQRFATIELSLAPLSIPRRKKEKLIKLCADAFRKHPLLIGSHDYQAMMPSYLLSIADVADDTITPVEYINEAVDYIVDVLEPLSVKKKHHDESAILYSLYHKQANILRIPEDEREEIHELFEKFAHDAVSNEWTDEDIATFTQDIIIPAVNRIAFHQVDSLSIIESMVNNTVEMDEQGASVDEVLQSAHILALSLHKHATHSIKDLYKLDCVQELLQIFSLDVNKKVPDVKFEDVETKINESIQPVLDLLKVISKRRKHNNLDLTPEEVFSTFELASAEILRLFMTASTSLRNDERRRESCGYYPRDSLPPTVATYLSRKVIKASKSIEDPRVIQSTLGMLCVLGESSNNLKQMKNAVDKSIVLTDGRVTETSPYPIPEALAAQYQERGDYESALEYYKIAAEGIRTYVPREKTDAIVLNACLVQAKFDSKEALKMAFEFSPYFNDVQQYGVTGPGRSILVQQCNVWAEDLGFSLDDAKNRLMNVSEEEESVSDSPEDDSVIDGQPTLEKSDTDSTDDGSDGAHKTKHVTIEEPPEVKKKRRKKKVKKSTVTQGLGSSKSKEAVKGDKSCEKCTIM